MLSQFATLDRNTLMTLLSLLWQRPQRELQYLAIDIAISKVAVLCGTSSDECLQAAQFVGAELITTKSWWDTVDMIASNGMYTCYYLKLATGRPCVPALLVSGTVPACTCYCLRF